MALVSVDYALMKDGSQCQLATTNQLSLKYVKHDIIHSNASTFALICQLGSMLRHQATETTISCEAKIIRLVFTVKREIRMHRPARRKQ